jgi:hypothetical protein
MIYRVELGTTQYILGDYDSNNASDAKMKAQEEFAELCTIDHMVVYPKTLTEILVNQFMGWINTLSEELLKDGGLVKDHLSDVGFPRSLLSVLSDEDWDLAWAEFDRRCDR